MLITNFSLLCIEGHKNPLKQTEPATEHLRENATEIIGKVLLRVFFCTDWLLRVSPKNNCNEKLLKVGVSEVGKIKIRAGKQGTTH